MSTIAPPLPTQTTVALARGPRVRGAALADASGVPLEIDGEAIPIAGFAQLTLVGALLGGLLAAGCDRYSGQPRQVLLWITAVLTAPH